MNSTPSDSRTASPRRPYECIDLHGAGVYPYCVGTGRRTVHAYGTEIGTFDCPGCESPECPAKRLATPYSEEFPVSKQEARAPWREDAAAAENGMGC